MRKKNSHVFNLSIIGLLYFIFGFVTWLNSLLIPFLKTACQLPDSQAYWVTFAFYISYFVMSIPSSVILKRTGFAKGMSLGLMVMAIGSILFLPAASTRSYMLFLVGLFIQGTGLSLLQTAVNPYVTILGPIESAAKRMSIMGLFNKFAGMIGILLISSVLFSGMDELTAKIATLSGEALDAELSVLAARIRMPYIIITVLLCLLALMISLAHLPEVKNEDESVENNESRSIFRIPYLWLGVLTLFLYVGVEVIAIDTLGLYAETQGISKDLAPKLGTLSLIALTLGYVLGILFVPKYVSQSTALSISAILGFIFAVAALLTTGTTSIIFVVLLSFAHAMMWPGIWPLAIEKLGSHTALGSALLIMAIAGGAVLPLLYGGMVDALGGDRQLPYVIMLPCYLMILYYSIWGHKIGKSK
ncbi:MAG: sugar MFS transporter [Bacteroidales bacterium]|nr:sugar MFS transporter [Bacteroidales bacterium]